MSKLRAIKNKGRDDNWDWGSKQPWGTSPPLTESSIIVVQISVGFSKVLWACFGLCSHQTPLFFQFQRSLVSLFTHSTFLGIKYTFTTSFKKNWLACLIQCRLYNYGIGIHLIENPSIDEFDTIVEPRPINPKDNHMSFQVRFVNSKLKNTNCAIIKVVVLMIVFCFQ